MKDKIVKIEDVWKAMKKLIKGRNDKTYSFMSFLVMLREEGGMDFYTSKFNMPRERALFILELAKNDLITKAAIQKPREPDQSLDPGVKV